MSNTITSLYSDNPQEYANNLRGYLDANGMPPTAENLNRISLEVSAAMRGGEMPSMDAAVERTMAPRRGGTARTAAQQPHAGQEVAGSTSPVRIDAGKDDATAAEIANVREGAMNPNTRMPAQPVAEAAPTRGAQVAEANRRAGGSSGDANGIGTPDDTARPGTIPRARMIDENDPTAGMFNSNAVGGRQADETGVDQTGLGLTILGAAVPAIGAGARAGAGASALPQQMARRIAQAGGQSAPPRMGTAVDPMRARVVEAGAQTAAPVAAPAASAAPQTFTPARVTVTGPNGASAVRDPNAFSQPAGRTAMTRPMQGGSEAVPAEAARASAQRMAVPSPANQAPTVAQRLAARRMQSNNR